VLGRDAASVSILAYVGMPGAGKSYGVVAHQILPALKAGRIVVTNVPVFADLLRKDIPGAQISEFPAERVALQPELILEMVPPGAVFILDEVWRLFPSGVKANQVPTPFKSFFAEHRHRMDVAGNSTQIVLVTQDLAQIGAFARQLVEQTFRITKLSTLGIPMSSRYRVDTYAGPQAGPNPPAASRINQMFGRYDKKVYQYYQSHTQSEAGADTAPNEDKIDKRANMFNRPFYKALPFVAAAFIGLIVWKGGYIMQKYGKKKGPDAALTSGASPPASGSLFNSNKIFQHVEAKIEGAGDFRVVGVLINEESRERSYAVLSDGKGPNVKVPYDQCVVLERQPIRCKLDGFEYSEAGHGRLPGNPVVAWNSSGTYRPKWDRPKEEDKQSFDDIGDAFGPEVLVEDPVTHVVKFTHPHAIRPHVSASNADIK
jgi:zona occludens toxin (predicted ATPase)